MIRVLLADDQELVRAGFRALLHAQADIEVVGESGDGDEAVRLSRQHRPDIVHMDIRIPGTYGLAATRAITTDEWLAGVRIVILTTFELDQCVFEAVRAGAAASSSSTPSRSNCCRRYGRSPRARRCCRRA